MFLDEKQLQELQERKMKGPEEPAILEESVDPDVSKGPEEPEASTLV